MLLNPSLPATVFCKRTVSVMLGHGVDVMPVAVEYAQTIPDNEVFDDLTWSAVLYNLSGALDCCLDKHPVNGAQLLADIVAGLTPDCDGVLHDFLHVLQKDNRLFRLSHYVVRDAHAVRSFAACFLLLEHELSDQSELAQVIGDLCGRSVVLSDNVFNWSQEIAAPIFGEAWAHLIASHELSDNEIIDYVLMQQAPVTGLSIAPASSGDVLPHDVTP